MKWLIQPTKVEENTISYLKNLLNQAGIKYDIVFPFKGKVLNPDKTEYHYDINETYFVCGSYSLTRYVYKDRKEAVFSLENYSYEDFINIFGKDNFVNYDAKIIHSNDLVWEEEEYFIRPVDDTKSFNGGIYNSNTFNYNGNIVVAKLKEIHKEHRFFVIDGEIITGSLYKINGSFSTSNIIDEGALNFAKKMIEKFQFSGFVIDIATLGNEYKIMELNCLNASGFYDINIYKLINSVSDFYENKSKKITLNKCV